MGAGGASGLSSMSSASRTLFALARNENIPYAHLFKNISERFRSPQAALLLAAVTAVIIAAITVGMKWSPFFQTITSE
ncbi:amino acid permease [Paenibacillus solisilvae]|uniref:Amino acid permease n=1 Tax=Paenibacillus solisilvae TaxID=2486751 RepID=A0ABW0VUL1_9BACL